MAALGEVAICFVALGGRPINSRLALGGLNLTGGETSAPGAHRVGVAVDLQPRHPQSGHAIGVDRTLPCEKFFNRQMVSSAGLLQAQGAAAYGGDDDRLAADDPALGIDRRQIGQPGAEGGRGVGQLL